MQVGYDQNFSTNSMHCLRNDSPADTALVTFTTVSCLRCSRPCDKQESPMRDCLCDTRTSTVTALHGGPSLSGAAPRF